MHHNYAKYLLTTLTAIFLIITVIVTESGCVSQGKPIAHKVVFVGIDISGSTQNNRKEYRKAFKMILDRIAPGDALVVERICENSAGLSTLPVAADFSKYEKVDGLFGAAQKNMRYQFEQEKAQIMKTVDKLLLQKSKQTDILGAVEVGSKSLASFKQPRKVLVLISDMMHQAGDYNFMGLKFDNLTIDRLLSREKEDGLPAIQDFTVYAIGATDEDLERMQRVRVFWAQYMKECGANLAPEHYGSAIARFGE